MVRRARTNKIRRTYTRGFAMNPSKRTTASGGSNSQRAAAAVTRGQERFKHALEENRRGNKELARQTLDAAIADYTEAIHTDPGHSLAYLLRAHAYEAKGDETKAEADLAQVRVLEAG